MTIPKEEANEFLRKTELHYGSIAVDPTDSGSAYEQIVIYSGELPISLEKEFQAAEKVGEEEGLTLVNQDFGKGEGSSTDYKNVFVAACNTLDELKEAPGKIARGVAKLEKELGIS